LNGKVERSHRTDEQEFCQLLTYTDDVDLHQKLADNLARPHGAFNGKALYETLRKRLYGGVSSGCSLAGTLQSMPQLVDLPIFGRGEAAEIRQMRIAAALNLSATITGN
jgi:hypothetical protein